VVKWGIQMSMLHIRPNYATHIAKPIWTILRTDEELREASETAMNWLSWWCYPTPFEGWGRGENSPKLNSRAMLQGLDQR